MFSVKTGSGALSAAVWRLQQEHCLQLHAECRLLTCCMFSVLLCLTHSLSCSQPTTWTGPAPTCPSTGGSLVRSSQIRTDPSWLTLCPPQTCKVPISVTFGDWWEGGAVIQRPYRAGPHTAPVFIRVVEEPLYRPGGNSLPWQTSSSFHPFIIPPHPVTWILLREFFYWSFTFGSSGWSRRPRITNVVILCGSEES